MKSTTKLVTKNTKSDANCTRQSSVYASTICKDKIFKSQPHIKKFVKKEQAIIYIQKHPTLHLFSEDVSVDGAKQFYTLDYDTVYQLCNKRLYHLYENLERNERIKLHIDIDIKLDKKNNSKKSSCQNLLNDTVTQAISLLLKQLHPYNIPTPQIIVLNGSTETKLSAHIIFVNIAFHDIVALKFFMLGISSQLITSKIIDLKIYRVGCFRMLWNSKFGKTNRLGFSKGVNYSFLDDEKLFMDCLVKNVNDDTCVVNFIAPNNVKIKRHVSSKAKTVPATLAVVAQTDPVRVDVLKRYLDLINVSQTDSYDTWLQVGMCLYSCNSTEESFNLWDQWSSCSSSYDCRDVCAYKWNSFRPGCYSLGTLKYLAKSDSPQKYYDLECLLEENMFKTVKFTKEYLLERDERLKDGNSMVAKHVCSWLNDDEQKILGMLSPYDTGKTTLIKQIFIEFNPPRVLFVSYRQTLTHDLYGNFNQFDVMSYLDGWFGDVDRVICQIDSLPKLLNAGYMFDGVEKEIPGYDLVVLDEIESLLAHFRSSTISEKEKIFNLLCDIIDNSKKVLALDGDLGNRSYEFLRHFEEPVILENCVKKTRKHFIFTSDKVDFEARIDSDLKEKEDTGNKNVVVVSMSSTVATYFYDKYKDKYKSVLHCAKSDDDLKHELRDVNSYWKQFKLIVYSPTVEAGVNFDCEHVNSIYVVLSSMSTSPRGLMQMISRVRKVKNSNVVVFLNNMPFIEKANFYKYEEVKDYVCSINKLYSSPKTVRNSEGKKVIRYEFNLYNKMLVYNETEEKNKNPSYFMAYLIKLLTAKGCTYELLVSNNGDCDGTKEGFGCVSIMRDEIVNAKDVNSKQFNVLLNKQKSNEASREDKIMIEKYMYKKNWKLDKIDAEYYGKTYVLFNLRAFLDNSKIDPYLTVDSSDKYVVNFDKIVKLEQIRLLKDVLTRLGFNDVADRLLVDRENFKKNVDVTMKDCVMFTNISKSQQLFGFNKLKIKSIKSFLGFMNSVLKDWGLGIVVNKKVHKIKKANKWKSINGISYCLQYVLDLNKYV